MTNRQLEAAMTAFLVGCIWIADAVDGVERGATDCVIESNDKAKLILRKVGLHREG